MAVRRAIWAAGAKLFFLPPYSSDLNPIEQLFAKLKLCCARPPSEPSMTLGDASGHCSRPSVPPSAPLLRQRRICFSIKLPCSRNLSFRGRKNRDRGRRRITKRIRAVADPGVQKTGPRTATVPYANSATVIPPNSEQTTDYCGTMKSRGITVAVLYIPYETIQDANSAFANDEDGYANSNIPNIPAALQACASPNFYFTATYAAGHPERARSDVPAVLNLGPRIALANLSSRGPTNRTADRKAHIGLKAITALRET